VRGRVVCVWLSWKKEPVPKFDTCVVVRKERTSGEKTCESAAHTCPGGSTERGVERGLKRRLGVGEGGGNQKRGLSVHSGNGEKGDDRVDQGWGFGRGSVYGLGCDLCKNLLYQGCQWET